MSEQEDQAGLDEIFGASRARMQRSVRRHIQYGSRADIPRLYEIAIEHEGQKLDKLAAEYDERGEDAPAEFLRSLKEYLPDLCGLRQN